jgi:hypothetical protein
MTSLRAHAAAPGHVATVHQLVLDGSSPTTSANGPGPCTAILEGLDATAHVTGAPHRSEHDMPKDLRARSAQEVFDDHLRLAAEHRFDEDIARNVAPDCVILERRGIFHGRDGARELARLLEEELPGAPYVYTNRLIADRVAFLEWTAEAANTRVCDGADSFLIENGSIVAQTIHYTVESTQTG